jgi:RNA polymerase-binding protein DksA
MAKGSRKPRASGAGPDASSRERLLRQREAAIAQLQRLGRGAEIDPEGPDGGAAVLDEGDEAQASERQEMTFAQRERLSERIDQLTRALERIDRGTYGTCEVCGRSIGPERLAAIPEVTTCRDCQERREREAAA